MTRLRPLRAPLQPSPTLAEVRADSEPHSPVRADEHDGELMTVKSWPYCEGHPHCHDRHTRQYAYGGRTGGTLDRAESWPVMITSGGRDPLWGKRLCSSHALIEFRCA